MANETRFAMLARSHPEAAARLLEAAQQEATRRYQAYQALAACHPADSQRTPS
jgi:pyruvate-ferredoxin/flavodoxin oxidoreductase